MPIPDNNPKTPIPHTGTLRYPIDALITLGRLILKAHEEHFLALRDAADAAGDEDEKIEQSDNFYYVNKCVWAIDSKRWKARAELISHAKNWSPKVMRYFEDPRGSEKSLFRLYGPCPNRVFRAAIQRRKDTRGDTPSDEDPMWAKEDALLDLLELIITNEGLFTLPTA